MISDLERLSQAVEMENIQSATVEFCQQHKVFQVNDVNSVQMIRLYRLLPVDFSLVYGLKVLLDSSLARFSLKFKSWKALEVLERLMCIKFDNFEVADRNHED